MPRFSGRYSGKYGQMGRVVHCNDDFGEGHMLFCLNFLYAELQASSAVPRRQFLVARSTDCPSKAKWQRRVASLDGHRSTVLPEKHWIPICSNPFKVYWTVAFARSGFFFFFFFFWWTWSFQANLHGKGREPKRIIVLVPCVKKGLGVEIAASWKGPLLRAANGKMNRKRKPPHASLSQPRFVVNSQHVSLFHNGIIPAVRRGAGGGTVT